MKRIEALEGELERVRAECDAARSSLQRLNRRCGEYEKGLAVKLEDAKRQGGSLGRGLANAGYELACAEAEKLRGEVSRLQEALREAYNATTQGPVQWYVPIEHSAHWTLWGARVRELLGLPGLGERPQ